MLPLKEWLRWHLFAKNGLECVWYQGKYNTRPYTFQCCPFNQNRTMAWNKWLNRIFKKWNNMRRKKHIVQMQWWQPLHNPLSVNRFNFSIILWTFVVHHHNVYGWHWHCHCIYIDLFFHLFSLVVRRHCYPLHNFGHCAFSRNETVACLL